MKLLWNILISLSAVWLAWFRVVKKFVNMNLKPSNQKDLCMQPCQEKNKEVSTDSFVPTSR